MVLVCVRVVRTSFNPKNMGSMGNSLLRPYVSSTYVAYDKQRVHRQSAKNRVSRLESTFLHRQTESWPFLTGVFSSKTKVVPDC